MKKEKTILFSDYEISPPSSRLRQSQIDSAIKSMGGVPRSDSFLGQLKTQITYMGTWFWLGLIAICAVMCHIITHELVQFNGITDPAVNSLIIFGMSGPIITSLSAPVLSRSFSHNMWELENACFHNLPRLTAIRLIICGLGAAVAMLPLALAGFGITGAVAGITALLAPFLLSSGINYAILGRLRGNPGVLCCVGVNFALAFILTIPTRTPYFFYHIFQNQNGGRALICTLTLIFCAGSFILGARDFLKKFQCEVKL